ncbi:MAG TPA: hypothetical protein VKX25_17180 [Bryobacteraceae bacterium]|nr:hypothetical protein [Bryobacteraceae bacterium]
MLNTQRTSVLCFATMAFLGVSLSPALAQSTSTQAKSSKTATAKPATKPATTAKPAAKPTTTAKPGTATAQTTVAKPVSTANASTGTPATGTTATGAAVTPGAANANVANQTATSSQIMPSTTSAPTSGGVAAADGNMPGATNGATATNGFAAGLGTFKWGDQTLTAYNCLRSGTRVFCDFDYTKQQVATIPARNGWAAMQLVGSSGRVFTSHDSFYVDPDGTPFPTAEVSANVPVRMVIEFDDVPATYNSVALAWGTTRIQSVPVTLIPQNQAANTIPSRQAMAPTQSGQAQTAGNGGAANPAAASDSAAGKANDVINKAKSAKSSWRDVLKNAATIKQQ